jgi:NhaP-type Na+/H+ or K+/H+ antiporter
MNVSATIALVVGWIGSAAFLFPYMKLVPLWWKEPHRVHVVAFSSDVFLFFTLYLLRPLIEPHIFQYIRLVLLWVLALLAAWRAVIFLGGLLRSRKNRRGRGDILQSPGNEES